ncbi:MAG: cbb3-type cytochrome c oxidase N-terminal domain-containing protein [Puia sp.]|nr:cbb3-type cytochrome c oxidase N-terminal domain-containing protein [Puia sp.]
MTPSSINNPFVVIMIIIMVILALAIGLLANVLLGAAQMTADKDHSENRDPETDKTGTQAASHTSIPVALIAGLLLGASLLPAIPAFAQDQAGQAASAPAAAAPTTASNVNGISDTAFYMMTGVVFVEILVLVTLLYNVKILLAVQKKRQIAPAGSPEIVVPAKPRISWWDRFNRFKPVDQEFSLDLGHDYDGIRELDNRLPPWWLYGFYGTILFACIYLWRYHVVHTAPLSGEEFQIAMQKAEVQKAAYLKKAANNVDETTVKLLTDPADLAAGKAVFETVCFACHGKSGEGGVGPNLTDDYWLHGGGISDIFKTIKYGWPDKGMKSWKDDYSPPQIAQIASYIKSLKGTHPANPKPPQGVIDNQ